MLVMYTLNQSVSSKLPPTSYVKFIDIWILFGMSQPFFIILILVLVEHLPKDSVKSFSAKEAKQNSYGLHRYVKFFGQVINPIWQILFVIIYSCIAMIFYYQWIYRPMVRKVWGMLVHNSLKVWSNLFSTLDWNVESKGKAGWQWEWKQQQGYLHT